MTTQSTQKRTLRAFGATGLRLSPLGLGCWQFSKGRGLVGGFWPDLSESAILEIVRISLEGGINWFDTAEVYGGGQSEQMLAAALDKLGPAAADVYIATKWWPAMRTAANIARTIDERLRCLGGRSIALYQVHQPFSLSSVRSEMTAMAELVQKGHIANVGVSNYSARQMRDADRALRDYGLRLASNQVKYSMLDRRIERNGILETAQELGIAIIAYSPLEQGILSGKFHKQPELVRSIKGPRKWMSGFRAEGLHRTQPLIEALDRLAERYAASPTQIALNWLIHAHGDNVFAIPGASKPHHAEENVKAMCFRLSDSEIGELSDIAKVRR
ncbi:aldo/keto reductase [Paenibacillus sp. GP183]|uniref:aldo/keto reductase n=1 Tax=Paenibacillus sp. GP183 TaxID=1882751 RepID=UPI000B88BA44|nr:aldo/keto reductase [Paenibacillus sp. GP183]